jgi:tRNA G18 (ribose-2'-O)-methylase SpoU
MPFAATGAAQAYDRLAPLPVVLLLADVRSMYNVGSFFRTADAAAIEALALCGITACPPKNQIRKTALGADESVRWQHHPDPVPAALALRARGFEIVALETSLHSVDLFDWTPHFPVCVMFGHETDGLHPALLALADTHVRIPMLGRKHSLNVATAAGVVAYELLRKYRRARERCSP